MAHDEIDPMRFVESIPLRDECYAGVVEAEKSLTHELAGLIADTLREPLEPSLSSES